MIDPAYGAMAGGAVIGLIGTLVGNFVWKPLVLRVHKIEENTVSREIFDMHQKHIDGRLDRQDVALAATMSKTERALGILERMDRRTSPPPRGG